MTPGLVGDRWHFLAHDSDFIFTEKNTLSKEVGTWCHIWSDFGEQLCSTIWVGEKSPFHRLYDSFGRQPVVNRIKYGHPPWLSSYSLRPIKVSSAFQAEPTTLSRKIDYLTLQPPYMLSFIVVLNHVHHVSALNNPELDTQQDHIQWGSEQDAAATSSLPDEPLQLIRQGNDVAQNIILAVLSLMRYQSVHDKGVDHSYERLIDGSVHKLFETCCSLHMSDLDEKSALPTADLPCIITYAGSEWNESAAMKMAAAAYPTLLALMDRLRVETETSSCVPGLPDHCFVYGLHWTLTRLRIVIHFPLLVSLEGEPTQWMFYQIVLAEHWIGLPEPQGLKYAQYQKPLPEDEAFLFRWRLVIALLAVHSHVQRIQSILKARSPKATASFSGSPNLCLYQYTPNVSKPAKCSSYLESIRSHWSADRFQVPKSWIPADDCTVQVSWPTTDRTSHTMGFSWKMIRELVKIYLHSLRDTLVIAPTMDPAESGIAPDFSLGSYHPGSLEGHRMKALRKISIEEPETEMHLYKLYDIMSMAVTDWRSVNGYVGHALAGFVNYGVLWDPIPEDVNSAKAEPNPDPESIVPDQIVADFILIAVQDTNQNGRSHTQIPEHDPVIFLGLRTTAASEIITCEISSRDLEALREAALRYVEQRNRSRKAIAEKMQHLPEGSSTYNPWESMEGSLLLGTYVAPGFVHILAFQEEDTSSEIKVVVLDSLPVSKIAESKENIVDRVRLSIALFTLQRHVARFGFNWSELCFNDEDSDFDCRPSSSISLSSNDPQNPQGTKKFDTLREWDVVFTRNDAEVDRRYMRDAELVDKELATWWQVHKRDAFVDYAENGGKDSQPLDALAFVQEWVYHIQQKEDVFNAERALGAFDQGSEEEELRLVFGPKDGW